MSDEPRLLAGGSLRDRLRAQVLVPVVAAPMFLCTGPDLAVAACAGGVVGTLTLNHCRDVAELDGQLRRVRTALDRVREAEPDRVIGPLAVNTSLGLDRVAVRALLDACRRRGVEVVITANGDPAEFVPAAHDAGVAVLHDVTSMRFATKAMAAGVDGLVAIGAGGGGHSGPLSPLTFVPMLRAAYDGLIVLAGTVTTGAMVRAAEVLGADLAYVGTRFIATHESLAPAAYKEMLVASRAEDLRYTSAVNGVAANWLEPALRRVGVDVDALPATPARGHAHLPEGVRPWRDVWSAGQGVSLIDEVLPAAEVVARLRREYVAACATPDLAGPAA
ncbi:nitronate monooxygenase [Nocardioides carbamazepini]|uniref:NAD(P)H-dependent flavin oxidoreductase n=1 Tax=Nocardioides carbamazepini TaxID=2854259 RepID=UPI002149D17C|nr:nitronate monooxygenase [Nocardioides carbamazepini]MCR1785046.1 nitronate monooxygenase [Nocardioides carbamazepini]